MPVPGMRRVLIERDGAIFTSKIGLPGEEVELLHELQAYLGFDPTDTNWYWWVEASFRGAPWTEIDWPDGH